MLDFYSPPSIMSATLTLQNISYRQAGFQLLANIDFSASCGQIIGLIGVNGAGKSTTLKIAAGLLRPDSGRIIHEPSVKIGYVPETPALIPSWTVRQFLVHMCTLHSIRKSAQTDAIKHVSKVCELDAIISKQCTTLSKGNQQRVNLAQALLHKPKLLILDEPTSGLDPQQIRQFRQLLTQLKSHTAILFSSHIMQEVTALCDKAIVIHQGKQVGELDLSARNNRVLIEFSTPVADSQFQHFSSWQSGNGLRHQFLFSSPNEKDHVLAFCLANNLSIARIVGLEALAEQEFLSLIGHEATHA